ncbi:MAG: antiterminator LoaP [Lachnospiraceae bacterium]|nr:antiterminator LoaP [Lachnospiraceae bacterium]
MYYVIQVAPGMEERTETWIRNKVKHDVYDCCFHPVRHRRKKFHGEWKDLYEKLLPGYVFIVSDLIHELYQELGQVPAFTKILGKEGDYFTSLHENEVDWLGRIMVPGLSDEGYAEIGLSKIIVTKQNTIEILSGPLQNLKDRIRKINLHKRIAEVEVDFMGRKKIVYLGIELVKTGEDLE